MILKIMQGTSWWTSGEGSPKSKAGGADLYPDWELRYNMWVCVAKNN